MNQMVQESKSYPTVSKSSVLKLAKKAGVKDISDSVPEEMNGYIQLMIRTVLNKSVILTQSIDRKIISLKEIKYALDHLTIKLYDHDGTIPKCKSYKKGTLKKNKYFREIRFYQKQSGCLYIPKSSFKTLVKQTLHDIDDSMKLSTTSIEQLQVVVEDLCIVLLDNSNLLAIHANRTTIEPADIAVTKTILLGGSRLSPILGLMG